MPCLDLRAQCTGFLQGMQLADAMIRAGQCGNTTAATLPIAFHEARSERELNRGDLVCFVALGSGVNWGALLYRC